MATVSRWSRLRTVLGWPFGIAVVSWRYMWRTTPLHRSEETGSPAELQGLADEALRPGDGRQPATSGVGPLLHRRYSGDIVGTQMEPDQLIDRVAGRLNQVSPEMAVFRKVRGTGGGLHEGDEVVVRMPGPWDGPVRVTHRDATSFRLSTLKGHLEAGQIEFRASRAGDALRFEIESWARAGDRLSNLMYNKLRLAKEIQLTMWTHFVIRAATLAKGRLRGGVTIKTHWVDWPKDDRISPPG
ncbi:MAG TPA: DUF1990 family protein [Streptosporangiaceae bacterium]|jgi:hypothetical protein|nr:DUF1990 family protein [Streptosporangiaceae bacterium]